MASSWDQGDEKPLPSTKTATGDPSASGLKAKFERMANPPPPKKTMGKVSRKVRNRIGRLSHTNINFLKVAWKGEADQGRKKSHIPGQDPTKPPPARSLDSLP